MSKESLKKKLENDFPHVLQFLKNSIDINKGQGSAAFFSRYRHPLKGWAPAYPETTGYIIPTFYDYADFMNDPHLRTYAIDCADWLLSVQHTSGGFPSLYADNEKLSVFNTAQIILGLHRTYQETKEDKYLMALQKAYKWLLNGAKKNTWGQHSYVNDYIPAYYTRVVYPMLQVQQAFDWEGKEKLKEIIFYFSYFVNKNGSVTNWGFKPNQPAFTHTIAYTIRGFLESGCILQEEKLINQAKQTLQAIHSQKEKHKKTAGTYNEDFIGDYSFTCLTGLYQLSIAAFVLYKNEKESIWKDIAISFLEEGAAHIPHNDPLTYKYAISGSSPLWGKYMKFKYPNWVSKFYLDAVLHFMKMLKET